MNPALSIAIPTHNRFDILRDNLLELLPELIETGVTVHIADGGTDGLTEAGIGALQRAYPGIFYHRGPSGLPYDRNCLAALGLPSTAYVWYLADALRILPGGVKRVLAALEATPCDFAVVDLVARGPIDLPAGLHRDPVLVLERLAWHLTLAGSTIYARQHLVDLEARYGKYLGSSFSHLGIVLEALPGCQRGLLWLDESWLAGHPRKVSSWIARTVEVFARDWAEFVLSLPDCYPQEAKLRAIREHSLRTGLLEWKSLGRLRRKGFLDHALVLHHERHLRLASGVPFPAIELISRTPRWLAAPLAKLGRLAERMSLPGR
jgi:glycosyltransferase involved in cell wall biosynthesis